ncbi:MAG: hypothetical protein CM15mP89_0240 [Gammaproteobacteria bacterium]|nr:MAG: hypothetical protein CM15mP89_0240 [Gammaproteobacteria bacterium]
MLTFTFPRLLAEKVEESITESLPALEGIAAALLKSREPCFGRSGSFSTTSRWHWRC